MLGIFIIVLVANLGSFWLGWYLCDRTKSGDTHYNVSGDMHYHVPEKTADPIEFEAIHMSESGEIIHKQSTD